MSRPSAHQVGTHSHIRPPSVAPRLPSDLMGRYTLYIAVGRWHATTRLPGRERCPLPTPPQPTYPAYHSSIHHFTYLVTPLRYRHISVTWCLYPANPCVTRGPPQTGTAEPPEPPHSVIAEESMDSHKTKEKSRRVARGLGAAAAVPPHRSVTRGPPALCSLRQAAAPPGLSAHLGYPVSGLARFQSTTVVDDRTGAGAVDFLSGPL